MAADRVIRWTTAGAAASAAAVTAVAPHEHAHALVRARAAKRAGRGDWYVREKTGHALAGARQWIPAVHIEDPVKPLVMGLPLDLQFGTKGQPAEEDSGFGKDCFGLDQGQVRLWHYTWWARRSHRYPRQASGAGPYGGRAVHGGT